MGAIDESQEWKQRPFRDTVLIFHTDPVFDFRTTTDSRNPISKSEKAFKRPKIGDIQPQRQSLPSMIEIYYAYDRIAGLTAHVGVAEGWGSDRRAEKMQ